MQQNKKYWEEFAKEYHTKVAERGDTSQENVVNPAVFELLGDLAGKTVFDAGCGNGYLARRMAKTASRVEGIDLTEKLIEFAKSEDNPLNLNFQVANLEDIPFDNETFDVVLSNLVLIDVENLNKAVSEIARVLKKDGKLVVSILHPCFENPPRTYSIFDDNKKRMGRVVQKYFDTGLVKDENEMTESGQPYQHYHFTLSDYLNTFINTGLKLTKMVEPQVDNTIPDANEHTPTFLIMQFTK